MLPPPSRYRNGITEDVVLFSGLGNLLLMKLSLFLTVVNCLYLGES